MEKITDKMKSYQFKRCTCGYNSLPYCQCENNGCETGVETCLNTAYNEFGMSMSASSPSKKSTADLMASFRTTLYRQFLFQRRKIKKAWRTTATFIAIATIVIYIELSCSVIERCFETNFRVGFRYPSDLENFPAKMKRFSKSGGVPLGFSANVINPVYQDIQFLNKAESTTISSVGLLIIVKSATRNYKKRKSIRRTWGESHYLNLNNLAPDLPTRLVFICGLPEGHDGSELFPDEKDYGDIVVGQFQDAYGNNTLKTMLAIRWAVNEINRFKYLMIVDDDMYVNPTNVIDFLKNIPRVRVKTVISNNSGVTAFYPIHSSTETETDDDGASSNSYVSLENRPLIMGQLIVDSKPFRNVIGAGSKWSMSLKEYPYNYFPPYIAGGATILDATVAVDLYYASFFTKHCWIDDVYVGILAYKLGVTLTDSHFMDSSYRGNLGTRLRDKFDKMLAFHGLQCPEQLVELWSTLDIESLTDCYYISNIL